MGHRDTTTKATNMPIISFLQSNEILRKTIEHLPNGTISKGNYPHVYKFSSNTESLDTLQDVYEAINEYAARGFCLLKGALHRPLVDESRAGATATIDETTWVCFDLDKTTSITTPELFMGLLGASDVSYIVQYSSSYGISRKGHSIDSRLSCHIFILLDAAMSAPVLKQWLIQLNFQIPQLRMDTKLTKTASALSYPLDITTCQNDKLLYIAPPKLIGLKDDLPDRIALVRKAKERLEVPAKLNSIEHNKMLVDTRINELRDLAGMPARKRSVFKTHTNQEYLSKPDQATVTGIKQERGFVYLSLNGSKSTAYYHHEDNFELIHNFKGEPVYRTSELVPDYYAQCVKAKQEQDAELQKAPAQLKDTKLFLAFRDLPTSAYYNGWYDTDTEELTLYQAKNEAMLRQFLANRDLFVPDNIPEWTVTFDPTSSRTIDLDQQQINTYQATQCLTVQDPKPTPVINWLLTHMCGDSIDTVNHFIQWLAFIVQKRTMTKTAWVFHGTQGTGKGTILNKLLRPLFHPTNVAMRSNDDLTSIFNDWVGNSQLIWIDEVELTALAQNPSTNSKLKMLITEPTFPKRGMHKSAIDAQNFSNWIFTANRMGSVDVPANDRRFNIAPYQPREIDWDEQGGYDVATAKITEELNDFYTELLALDITVDIHRPLKSQARADMIEMNVQAIDKFTQALLTGNLQFFIEQLPYDESTLSLTAANAFVNYRTTLREIIVNIESNNTKLTREMLQTMCTYIVSDRVPTGTYKFAAYLNHHGIKLKNINYRGTTARGIDANWVVDQSKLDEYKTKLDGQNAHNQKLRMVK